jgi:hypothetical protein
VITVERTGPGGRRDRYLADRSRRSQVDGAKSLLLASRPATDPVVEDHDGWLISHQPKGARPVCAPKSPRERASDMAANRPGGLMDGASTRIAGRDDRSS